MAYDLDKRPAGWVRAKSESQSRKLLLIAAGALMLMVVAMFTGLGLRKNLLTLPLLLGMFVLKRVFDREAPLATRWADGARAEGAVGETLNELRRNGYIVMHDVEQAYEGNVDHLVSGPTGVFMIETKARRYLSDHLRKAKRQAAKLHDGLGVWVTPVICVYEGQLIKPFRHSGVWIVPRDALLDWIMAQRNAQVDFERLSRFADGL
ncbi:hypothetical protein AYO48_03170 [Gaiella sp. SCGC AG-212-M14]|nr:hypothetical protein AYO48_03170 [Gaiella sp. SCGC AG-212-M14]